jgi:hypothetical protein
MMQNPTYSLALQTKLMEISIYSKALTGQKRKSNFVVGVSL